jgi:hypothetical protein
MAPYLPTSQEGAGGKACGLRSSDNAQGSGHPQHPLGLKARHKAHSGTSVMPCPLTRFDVQNGGNARVPLDLRAY